jgi:hypothetical protein
MSPDDIRTLGHALIEAADKADAEGRDRVSVIDIDFFVVADDAAREALQSAIEKAR